LKKEVYKINGDCTMKLLYIDPWINWNTSDSTYNIVPVSDMVKNISEFCSKNELKRYLTTTHFRGHMWHIHSVTFNHVMMWTFKIRSDDFNFTTGNLSVASLIAALLYQWNSDRQHKSWNIVQTKRYCPCCMYVLLECC